MFIQIKSRVWGREGTRESEENNIQKYELTLFIHTSFFDYKITCVNSQQKNTNSKGDFVLIKKFGLSVRFLVFQNNLV